MRHWQGRRFGEFRRCFRGGCEFDSSFQRDNVAGDNFAHEPEVDGDRTERQTMKSTQKTILYGFKSCDMVRNAMKWLDANGIAYEFFDYRRDTLDPQTVDDWFARAGWENVFNRNSTTFKDWPESKKTGLNEKHARQMILDETNLIKRPVLDTGTTLLLGFKADTWAAALGK